jgi:squalene cyclase
VRCSHPSGLRGIWPDRRSNVSDCRRHRRFFHGTHQPGLCRPEPVRRQVDLRHFPRPGEPADGGWGETIRSDEDIRYAGKGNSTPLPTAHLTSTLLRIGYPPNSPLIGRAIDYLVRAQSPKVCGVTTSAPSRFSPAACTIAMSSSTTSFPLKP